MLDVFALFASSRLSRNRQKQFIYPPSYSRSGYPAVDFDLKAGSPLREDDDSHINNDMVRGLICESVVLIRGIREEVTCWVVINIAKQLFIFRRKSRFRIGGKI
jgi:hypothetical protein